MHRPARTDPMRLFALGVVLAVVAATGCSRDAGSSEPVSGHAVEPAAAADFMRAYTAGVDSVERPAHARRGASRLRGVDRDFAQGYAEIMRTPLHDIPGFIASGDADALISARYAALALDADTLLSANVLLFVSGWEAVSGAPASARQAQGLRRQMTANWVAAGAGADPAETARQRRILELVSASITREVQRLEADGDAAALARFRAGIREDFQRQSGNDLARFDLGDDGFAAR